MRWRAMTWAGLLLMTVGTGVWAGETLCNGHTMLCECRCNEVTFPGTHNSYSNTEEGWSLPNQTYPMARQLADGIRYMALDLQLYENEVMLCHHTCRLGKRRFTDALMDIGDFLKKHPHDVLVLNFESYVPGDRVKQALREAGLLAKVHVQPKNTPWPTLGEMTTAGHQLVLFTGKDADAFPGYHGFGDYVWGTGWNFQKLEDMDCGSPDRYKGDPGNALYDMAHFLLSPWSQEALGKKANARQTLMARLNRCRKATGRFPNFIVVDHHHVGDLFSVVAELNGVASTATGRGP